MNTREAIDVLLREMEAYRRESYPHLVQRIGHGPDVCERTGESGVAYQIEIDFIGARDGHVYVIGSIDDGGLRAFLPITRSFIKSADGSFVGEELRTGRLRLRPWRPSDRDPFAELNADPRVMRYFPARLSRDQSDALADRIETHLNEHGWGLWAVEIPGIAPFAGFIGLARPGFDAHFTPCVEIGWRLSAEFWGHGYATEGALEVLAFGFRELALNAIVSFTTEANLPSRRVMERIGMTHDPADDFDHPSLPDGHPLRRHVLYRKKKET